MVHQNEITVNENGMKKVGMTRSGLKAFEFEVTTFETKRSTTFYEVFLECIYFSKLNDSLNYFPREIMSVRVKKLSDHAPFQGPGCPTVYHAGPTNQTSLVRFPSPLNFSYFHVILIRSLSGSEPTIIWKSHYNIICYCGFEYLSINPCL